MRQNVKRAGCSQSFSLFHNAAISQDFRLVPHGIPFIQFADDTAGIARGKAACGDGTGNHAPCPDDAAVPDGDTGENGDVGTDPAAIAHMDRPGVAQAAC